MSWLSSLSKKSQSNEERLEAALAGLGHSDLQKLAEDLGTAERQHGSDLFIERCEAADRLGRGLAREQIEKQANLASTLVGMAGGRGNGLLRSAAGAMMRSPGKAMALGGAGVGAAVGGVSGALRDPGHDAAGNPNSRIGAMLRGAVGGAALGGAAGGIAGQVAPIASRVRGAGTNLSHELRATSWANQSKLGPAAGALPASLGGSLGRVGEPSPVMQAAKEAVPAAPAQPTVLLDRSYASDIDALRQGTSRGATYSRGIAGGLRSQQVSPGATMSGVTKIAGLTFSIRK